MNDDTHAVDTEVIEDGEDPRPLPMLARRPHGGADLVSFDPVSARAFIMERSSDEAVDESQAAMAAYDKAVRGLIGPNDVVQEGGREFKKKSAWKKLKRHFRIDTEVVSKAGRWVKGWDPTTGREEMHYESEVVMRGIAPWGQRAESTAACDTRELRFYVHGPACPRCGGPMWDNRNDSRPGDFACKDRKSCGGSLAPGEWTQADLGLVPNKVMRAKAHHDCLATAETRATNRVVSDLIAAGEVSADEIEGSAREPYVPPTNRAQGGTKKQATDASLDDRIGFGKYKANTYRGVIESGDLGYVEWLLTADRVPDPVKELLRVELDARKGPQEEDDGKTGDRKTGNPKGAFFAALAELLPDKEIRDRARRSYMRRREGTPEDPKAWGPDHFATALDDLRAHGDNWLILAFDREVEADPATYDELAELQELAGRLGVNGARGSRIRFLVDHPLGELVRAELSDLRELEVAES